MKTLISIIICLFFCHLSYGQLDTTFSTTDKKLFGKIQSLKKEKIDTIVCFYITCNGSPVELPDTCNVYDIKYLLWNERNVTHIQRFDECRNYQSLIIENPVLSLIKKKYLNIRKSRLKSYVKSDHFCSEKIEIYTANKLLKTYVDLPDLDKYWYQKKLNIYYKYNRHSILNTLRTELEQAVKVYEKRYKK